MLLIKQSLTSRGLERKENRRFWASSFGDALAGLYSAVFSSCWFLRLVAFSFEWNACLILLKSSLCLKNGFDGNSLSVCTVEHIYDNITCCFLVLMSSIQLHFILWFHYILIILITFSTDIYIVLYNNKYIIIMPLLKVHLLYFYNIESENENQWQIEARPIFRCI